MDTMKNYDGVKIRIHADKSLTVEATSMYKLREFVLLNFNYISPPIVKEIKRKIKAIVDHHDRECSDERVFNYPQLTQLLLFLDGWIEK